MNAGIDMIYLHTKDYRLNNVDGWSIGAGQKVGDTPETWGIATNGMELNAPSYYVNRGKDTEYPCTMTVRKSGLQIQLNPSTLQHPYELSADLSTPVEAVKDHLNGFNVDVDLHSMTLTRVDLTKQRQMEQPCYTFNSVFTALKGKRMKGKQYEGGYQIGNKSRSAIFYDKSKQLTEVKDIQIPPNLLRGEARFTNARTIGNMKTGIGAGILKDLETMPIEQLTGSYNRFMRETIFRVKEGHQMTINFHTEYGILGDLIKAEGNAGVRTYERLNSVEHIILTFGSIEAYVEALRDHGIAKATAYRKAGELRELIQKKVFIDQRRKDKTLATTLDHLVNVFTA